MFQEVFNKHYVIGSDTFKVVLLIKKGSKFDAGMMPVHFLEIQKLPESLKYVFHKGEIGFNRGYRIVLNVGGPSLTWSDEVQRELINKIKNEKIPSIYFVNPKLATGFF